MRLSMLASLTPAIIDGEIIGHEMIFDAAEGMTHVFKLRAVDGREYSMKLSPAAGPNQIGGQTKFNVEVAQ